MKEVIVRIPEESEEMLTAIIEKFGAQIEEVKQKKKKNSGKKKLNIKASPTFLFGKWKDVDIDARKLREEAWSRKS